MKKIITLALAAVMTLGLVVLPQAADKGTDLQSYAAQLVELEEKQEELKEAEKSLEAAKKAEEEAKKAFEKDAKKNKDAYVNAITARKDAEDKVEAAKKAVKTAKANLRAEDYGYVTVKDENGDKLVEDAKVKAGYYKADELLKDLGLKDYILTDEDRDGFVEISGRKTFVVRVAVKRPLMVKAIDEEGRELGMYKVLTEKKAVNGWVTANEVAPKALTFKGEVQKEIGVDGYWVLADVKANEEQQFFNSFTKGGQNFITAVYTVAKRAKMDKNGKTTGVNSTKPGQVGKTGEVATVATGLGALMTLAGVVLATKRH